MQIHGFLKTTLLDYPEHLASTIFLGGCNFRCPFCHNSSLILNPDTQPTINSKEVLSYLKKRTNILDGVCITGGEPTLNKELLLLIEEIKSIGLKVKLDTNGYKPDIIDNILNRNMIDYIAMDIKSSKENYDIVCGVKNLDIAPIVDSVNIIMNSDVEYEFRTTLVRQLHSEPDIISIGKWIKGCRTYFLQNFKNSGNILDNVTGYSGFSKEQLDKLRQLLIPFVPNTFIRGE